MGACHVQMQEAVYHQNSATSSSGVASSGGDLEGLRGAYAVFASFFRGAVQVFRTDSLFPIRAQIRSNTPQAHLLGLYHETATRNLERHESVAGRPWKASSQQYCPRHHFTTGARRGSAICPFFMTCSPRLQSGQERSSEGGQARGTGKAQEPVASNSLGAFISEAHS